MDRKAKLRRLAFAALLVTGAVEGAGAQQLSNNAAGVVPASAAAAPLPQVPASSTQDQTADAATAASASSAGLTSEEASQSAEGNVAELQKMIRSSQLTEFRTTYNGSYGASLLFYAKDMTYYVALFRQKNFWRVIKTSDETRAEQIYREFARQTAQLSQVEIRRAQLEAQKAFTEQLLAISQDRANRLQADLDVAHQQQQIVTTQQQATRAETVQLDSQKAQMQEQLRAAQRQVRELQQQLDSGLPGTASSGRSRR